MSKQQVNVMVDVKQALNARRGAELVEEISRLPGVHRASVSASAPRLVRVDYDPGQVNTLRILGSVVHCGFEARLVGM